jgi:hypothetical protein
MLAVDFIVHIVTSKMFARYLQDSIAGRAKISTIVKPE